MVRFSLLPLPTLYLILYIMPERVVRARARDTMYV